MRDYKKLYVNSLVRIIEKSGKKAKTFVVENDKIDLICQIFGIEKSEKFLVTTDNTIVVARKIDYSTYKVIVRLRD